MQATEMKQNGKLMAQEQVKKMLNKKQTAKVKRLIDKVAAIVHLFRTSPLAARDLRQHQTKPYTKLRNANATRWGSTLDMLQRIYQCRTAVTSCLLTIRETRGREKPPPNLTEEEWLQVGAIIELLKPFQVATVFLSTQRSPAIGAVLPVFNNLQRQLQVATDDLGVIKALKPVLLHHLNEVKHHWAEIDAVQHVTSFLDPRTKVLLLPCNLLLTNYAKHNRNSHGLPTQGSVLEC